MGDNHRQFLHGDASSSNPPPTQNPSLFNFPPNNKTRFVFWSLLILNTLFLLCGQTAATLLGRFYYNQGGNSKWLATLIQTAGFPFLLIPLLFVHPSNPSISPPFWHLFLIYLILGLIIAGDNLMYSYGLLYLPVSTYSLVCASQLAFNAVFSYFMNGQKFTILILNSVVLLTFSAALLGVNPDSDSDGSSEVSRWKYILGFLITLGASATYSLILSLMQFSFEKIIKRETFSVVLDMQIYTSLVASLVSVIGLFASGEWKQLGDEMEGFKSGKISYFLTLIWTGVAWQLASVGVVGLVFVVSSLFSNVISTLALPILPVFAVIFFKDKMDGVKIIAMLIAIWGFVSYVYQHYLDDLKGKKVARDCEAGGNEDGRI
ncbi:hypothetical protein LUZ60_016917 [Juncus effusus]|nr:hypothetical protein LUZ60_016917 [Juncus effusus]